MSLNAKQKIFVKEYLIDKNATRAAKAAGYSAISAKQMGTENLSKPAIRAAIDEGLEKLAKKTDITAERVIKEISDIAFQKLTKKELKVLSGNKLKALETLAKHFKLLTDKIEHLGKDGESLVRVNINLPSNGRELIKPDSDKKDE